MHKPTICIMGLGLMGRPMARRLLADGWAVTGWNRSPLPQATTEGIKVVASLEQAVAANVCLLMLSDSVAVDDIMARLSPLLSAGQLVLDMGSSDPDHSKAHAEQLASRGIGWVDAPVSGGPEGAASGTLAIMAGGSQADIDQVWSILETLGGNVTHVGGPGSGHAVKVLNQVIVALTIEAVAEALVLAEQAGIDLPTVQRALQGGWADSRILQHHGTRMARRSYEPGGYARTQLKDLHMAQEMAAAAGLMLPHLESSIEMYQGLVAQGDGDLDHSALHKWILQTAFLRHEGKNDATGN